MKCEDVEKTLETYGTEGLSAAEKRHIRRCEHCTQLVHALESLESSLRALPVAPATRRASFGEVELPSLDSLDVIAERRAEAARVDWYRAITQVEMVPKRHRFGVPRIAARSQVSAVLGTTVAVLAILAVGLVAAIIWSELAATPLGERPAVETASDNTP
ncbi:MAG: hypothetical protein AAF658_10170 [Myxococcota bacterium]